MTSTGRATVGITNDHPLRIAPVFPRALQKVYAVAMTVVAMCLIAGGIGEAIAQDDINIQNHIDRAKILSKEAIADEKRIYNRVREGEVLILEGDSWFSLPFHTDISEELESLGYAVMSGAEPGDTLENMAFGVQLGEMVAQFRRLFEFGKSPKAILLSVGGNDVVGPNLEFFLNHSRSTAFGTNGANRWQEEILEHALRRIQSHLLDYIAAISQMCVTLYANEFEPIAADCRDIPIIVHGYDYPVPSGEGYKFLWFFTVKGPWLKPSFQRKLHSNWDPQDTLVRFINRHNENLSEAVDELNKVLSNPVCYLNLREEVQGWSDELHPDEAGMKRIAERFRSTIEQGC